MDIIWKAGQGIDLDAVERMKQHFPRPSKAPPVAWFMSEKQEYHSGLLTEPIEQLTASVLEEYLFDTGGGIKNFFRHEKWVSWYQYLLPHLSERIVDGDLLCHTLTYFFNVYPDGITEEYPGFREDVLKVLPYYITSKELYKDGDLEIDMWWFEDHSNMVGHWTNAFNVTMFFCLKYLTPQEIAGWVASFTNVEAVLLRGEIDKWITGAKKLFQYILNPELLPNNIEQFNQYEGGSPYLEASGIDWWHSFLVFGGYNTKQLTNYVPHENIRAFLAGLNYL